MMRFYALTVPEMLEMCWEKTEKPVEFHCSDSGFSHTCYAPAHIRLQVEPQR